MNKMGLTHIGIMNSDRTQVQGFANYNEFIKFLVENYNGDISFFEVPLHNFDLPNSQLFPKVSKIVQAKDQDSLISVMKKMRENRISCIPIERQINPNDEFTTRTVGIAYLSDLMFLLRIPNYYRYLEEPIINFIIDLNGLEEDGNYFDQFSQ